MTVEAQDMTTTTSIPAPELTAQDRCDRCGAQAYGRSEHAAGDLLWCAHHLAEFEDALEGCIVLDHRYKLAPIPPAAPL